MGAHTPLVQVGGCALGLVTQVVPQAPQLVALVLVFTCNSAQAWGLVSTLSMHSW
jgi:hypothetical protein